MFQGKSGVSDEMGLERVVVKSRKSSKRVEIFSFGLLGSESCFFIYLFRALM